MNTIFYQALIHAFKDSNGDGVGDIPGLISKLDYLQWLGVDCVWVPPFYASPMRDDGYDIADYYAINPAYGTMEDVEQLIAELHSRGMKIMTDLALNHTSVDHPWFQASRQDPQGPYGDFYVWGDDPQRYPEIRVIFTDTEDSNWAFDETRGQYYFHRFYSHQPDLNYDNPAVQEEILSVVRFWLSKGVDVLRLDAVPYLFERDGQGGESLPETFAFIRRIRALVDAEFPGAKLLAEANQPADKTTKYFDAGMHMCFNFPLMPKLYEALATSSATPVYEVMDELGDIPVGAWANFLRNHDELTLEMVTPAERQLMYETYLPDQQSKAHTGIARRLMPLMGGDRRKVELLFALLLALPGQPFIYYGDEIGMEDLPELPDRYAVRTPMLWEDGPGHGFSDAPSPHLPFASGHSVAAQQEDPTSLLNTVRGLITQRRQHPDLATASYEAVEAGVDEVLAFQRGGLLCLFNFSEETIDLGPVELGPFGYAWVPVES
ncbi:trehalose synthase [Corynebacterium phocae]|uniref:Trehalose synthase n=1 Tax=Corynebacterium phocae TaxID=161895 RepID=A0A1L7D4L6_9CORY|nr:alpha-amylase family glycosyl hydrolase [Corynebacterium phocae]APT93126.1 trehalose synthase [Corynebacterium phocae]KAA8722201.1 DUF3459 domain-containing protein [Corynebacterium phocae]